MTPIRLDGRVAIVTGAGGGLGRAHALALAARGAKVVVNDLGAARDGSGLSAAPADAVVAEIRAAGGEAVANADDVADPAGADRIASSALDHFGRIDVLVANAGFLRDRTMAKMEADTFEAVVRVHLLGTAHCVRAVWPAMRTQGYGRIVLTTSATGLYGNFGQANYGAAKLGIVGLMHTLRLEGAKAGIRVNSIAPVAATRMTDGTLPPETTTRTPPGVVSPAVVWLASEGCPLDGAVLVAGGGHFALARIVESTGADLAPDAVTPEAVAALLPRLDDWSAARPFPDALAALRAALGLGDG